MDMEEKMNELHYDILIRYFEGNCSNDDLEKIDAWIKESDENAKKIFQWEEIYHLGNSRCFTDDRLINKAEKRLDSKLAKEKKGKQKIFKLHQWIKYAAVITIVIAVSALAYWQFNTGNKEDMLVATTSESQVREIVLPDGTKVWLNQFSSLKYPRQFSEKERNVYLNGEAYFEVTKNRKRPFIVQSEMMKIKVLGTIFNLKCSPTCRISEATLIEGEIEVKGNNEEGMIILSPGQKAELNKVTKRMQVKEVDAKLDAVWHNNLIPFEKATIFNIAKTLERFYNVKIILSPDISTNKTYSGVLKKKDSIESVLKLLKNSIPMNYKIVDNNIFILPESN